MYAVYICFVVYVCNCIAVAKTCQKPYAKTPQKTHKNSAKIFYENINKNLSKYSKNFLISPNILNLNKKL